jgi:hypothetical protein
MLNFEPHYLPISLWIFMAVLASAILMMLRFYRKYVPQWYAIAVRIFALFTLLWSLTGIAENCSTQPAFISHVYRLKLEFNGALLSLTIFLFLARGEKKKYQQQVKRSDLLENRK